MSPPLPQIRSTATVTYHTRVPESLIPFCEAMAGLMPRIERNLYRDLEAGRAVTDLKRAYQRRYGINARHFNALYALLKGKIKSLIECRKRHIKHLQSSISGLEKLIRRWRKQVPHIPPACPLQQGDKTPRQLLRWRLHQKQRRLPTLKAQLERIQHEKPRLVFGGQKRWAAQFNLEANQYPDHATWRQDWQDARNSQFYFVGF